ncbi:MAG: hypothetical protein SFU98_22855 [Leptospiraceae bacterium]|nr:hypothetical protein [Leptospiraceae bacterium]
MPNKDFITLLKSDYQTYEKSVKSFLKNYTRIADFLQSLFQVIPAEFFILLGLTVLFLLVLNSVSEKSKRFHLLISVLLSLAICLFASTRLLHKMKDIREWAFVISGVSILALGYLVVFITYLITYAHAQYQKNKLSSPSTIEQSVYNLHNSYNQAMNRLHLLLAKKEMDLDEIKDKLLSLKLSTEGMILLLETNQIKKKVFEEETKEAIALKT